MASLVLGAAGAFLGAATGIPGAASLGWALGSSLGGGGAEDQHIKTPTLNDLRVSGTEYGQPIPWVQGAVGIAGQVWWNTDKRAHETTTTEGGKGGPEVTTTVTTFDMDMLIGLTDNQILGVARIWANGELIFTADSGATAGSIAASAETPLWTRMTVYTGHADQLPDPTYEAAIELAAAPEFAGLDVAPAYRERGTVFIEGLQLGQSGIIPNLVFEVVVEGTLIPHPWEVGTGVPSKLWTGVAHGNGLFVACAFSASTQIMTSENGIAWTGQAPTGTVFGEAVAFGNDGFGDAFVVVGSGGPSNSAMYSPNGVTWTDSTGSISGSWIDVCFGDGMYVAVSGNPSKVMTSINNGITWINRTPASSSYWLAVCWGDVGGGLFVAVADDEGPIPASQAVMTSPDGITWTNRTAASATPWNDVVFGNGLFVAVGNGTTVNNCVMTSPDGITWTLRTVPVLANWAGVAYGNGTFAAVAFSGSGFAILISQDGIAWTQMVQPTSTTLNSVAYGEGKFVAVGQVPSNSIYWDGGYTISKSPPSIQTVVERLCVRCGLDPSEVDASALSSITKPVRCLPVSQVSPTRSTLDLLASSWFFEATVSDKIYLRPRGETHVATIPYEDLGGGKDNASEPLALRQANDLEIAAQVAVTFSNVDFDYQNDTQMSDRLISAASETVTYLQLPLGMTPSEGKGVAETICLDQAASAVSSQISVLGDYARLEPTDPIRVTDALGNLFRMRIVKVVDSYPLLQYQLVMDETSVLESQGITSTDYESQTEVLSIPLTVALFLDIPILRDEDNDAGFYWPGKGLTEQKWRGAVLYSSTDDVNYEPKSTISSAAVFGTCDTALTAWTGTRAFDEKSSVQVDVGEGELESSTRDALLSSPAVNAALIGDELVQFRNAELLSPGVYKLTGFLRGGRGTEWAMGSHVVDERFILLANDGGIGRVPMANGSIGLERYYKPVSLNRRLATTSPEQFTNNAVGLMPFSPVNGRISRDASNNATITWQRRTRLAVRMIGELGISVPLAEESEQYEVDIYSSGAFTTVLRTITSTTPTASYTAAQQTTDGLTPGNTIHFKVYQMSVVVGRGFALAASR